MLHDLILTGISMDSDGNGKIYNHKAEGITARLGDLETLLSDPRFRSVPLALPAYHDYCAVLTGDELVELAAAAEMTEQLLAKLKKQVSKYKYVVAHIYEWETGLD